MSSVVVVHGVRQIRVKVAPSLLIREIKQRACEMLELTPELYELKTGKTVLNGALPFRLSNVVGNAKLTLVAARRKKSTPVRVKVHAVDLPPNFSDALVHEFDSRTSLISILAYFERKSGINFTKRSYPLVSGGNGRLMYEAPSVQLFNKVTESIAELNQSLTNLGIDNGSTSLRVRFKQTRVPFEEAVKEVEGYLQEAESTQESESPTPEPVASSTESTPKPGDELKPELAGELSDLKEELHRERTEAPEETPVNAEDQIIQRKAQAYVPSETQRVIPEDIGDVEMDAHQFKHYTSQLAALSGSDRQDGPLLTSRLRKNAKKTGPVKQCVVRVKFPDQTFVEATFGASDTVGDLHSFVKSVISHPELPFLLVKNIPRKYLADPLQKLIGDWEFGAREVVFFEWDTAKGSPSEFPKSSILKASVIEHAKSAQEVASIKIGEAPAQESSESQPATKPKPSSKSSSGKPSWLRLGRK
ncbi:UBX domain-containing protein 4 [Trichomonascus vanleenenianus]|uniref:Ubx4p n=1 Tax=Trichomonascus vanleenenianus TaxID=2268995 RepID=UPI003EC9D8CA